MRNFDKNGLNKLIECATEKEKQKKSKKTFNGKNKIHILIKMGKMKPRGKLNVNH